MSVSTLLVPSLILGIVAASRWRTPHFSVRILVGLLPPTGFVLAILTLHTLSYSFADRWIYHRLAIVVGFAQGYELYYPQDSGPVLNAIYGPIGYLTFLPIALFRSPGWVLLVAALINYSMIALPMLLFCVWSVHSGNCSTIYGIYALLLFCFQLVFDPSLRASAFLAHVDAPAIGYAGIALASIMYYEPRQPRAKSWLLLSVCSFAATLSVWSKQTFIMVVVIPLIYVGIAWGYSAFCRLLIAFAAAGILVPLILLLVMDPFAFYFNAFELVARHPWTQPKSSYGFWLGTVDTVKNFHMLLMGSVTVGVLLYRRVESVFHSTRLMFRERRQVVILMFGLSQLPFCTLAFIKQGGSVNNFAPMIYFLLAFLLLSFPRTAFRMSRGNVKVPVSIQSLMALAVGAIFVLPQIESAMGVQKIWPEIGNNSLTTECAYLEANKGKIYYPFNPLAHLLVEGKLYHCSFAVRDRAFGGYYITTEEFRKHIPEKLETIIIMNGENWPEAVPRHLLEFTVQVPAPQGFQGGWLCLQKATGAVTK